MASILGYLKKFLRKSDAELSESETELLRVDFKARYHQFKILLGANTRALELMAQIEQALSRQTPFGMAFVRSCCTKVAVEVFRMVKSLDRLAENKYQELYNSFSNIEKRIHLILSQTQQMTDERLTIDMGQTHMSMAQVVGSKMANLGEVKNQLGLRVPPGFTITTEAYRRFMAHNELSVEITRRIQAADKTNMPALYNMCADIQQMIMRADLPGELESAIDESWKRLEAQATAPVTVALRSSAIGEDTADSSFAGQYRSCLNVDAENLLAVYKEVVASKYSLEAITYRFNRGIVDEDVAMCVGCLAMVDAKCGGVAYSRDPMGQHRDAVLINAVWGLPKSVVDGTIVGDTFAVSRTEPHEVSNREIRVKPKKFVCYPMEGVCRIDLTGNESNEPALDDNQAAELAKAAMKLETHYGAAQDVEWAFDGKGNLFILQSRPLRILEERPEKECEEANAPLDIAPLVSGGVTASPGAASGPVWPVVRGSDLLQFPRGAVLVTSQALPRWAPLLNQAAAVVTEQGSFAGHLANVAREFQVPALFGLPDALSNLERGAVVTVDASNRTVYPGRVDRLLGEKRKKTNFQEGNPVYETLYHASRLIVPLNLLDPDANDFTASNCRTLHDITRFVHEKSIHEMFKFGRDHHFSERSSKQLYYRVPMQWWILNLDDGFSRDITGKYVRLDDIVSIPMLAIWQGIVAVPWEGPPPLDGKGLAAVMFGATTNRALTTGTRSAYSERNYFMISKNYCSLSSRLGFHFSTIEALVTDRPGDNYAAFQFKGGAADFDRRFERVRFLGDILETYGFRVDITEDALRSRIEHQDQEYMISRLRILGYLGIHTRQLDMIMSNPARVVYYRNKIKEDIEGKILRLTIDGKLLCTPEDPQGSENREAAQ